MIAGRLTRYFGIQFLLAVGVVFAGTIVLIAMVDFIEMLRRTGDVKDISALFVLKITIFRLPFMAERILPFAVMIGAMSSFLTLSRRLELVVVRAAGISAWQFVAPSLMIALLMGVVATTLYNPLSATLREQSVLLENEVFGADARFQESGSGFWVRQRSDDGQSIINAKTSRQQGIQLGGVSIFRFDEAGHFRDRIEAKNAVLETGFWQLDDARVFASGVPPTDNEHYSIKTNLTPTQVRESFATPETVPFWQLSAYIKLAENAGLAASGYRLQYYQLMAQPLYLAAMVLLAAAVSLRFFRFGGVQKMAIGGVAGSFALYILSKVSGDLSKGGLLPAAAAAGLPVMVGGLTGLIALLYQEDG